MGVTVTRPVITPAPTPVPVTTADGCVLERVPGSGPPVLLVHGASAASDTFRIGETGAGRASPARRLRRVDARLAGEHAAGPRYLLPEQIDRLHDRRRGDPRHSGGDRGHATERCDREDRHRRSLHGRRHRHAGDRAGRARGRRRRERGRHGAGALLPGGGRQCREAEDGVLEELLFEGSSICFTR